MVEAASFAALGHRFLRPWLRQVGLPPEGGASAAAQHLPTPSVIGAPAPAAAEANALRRHQQGAAVAFPPSPPLRLPEGVALEGLVLAKVPGGPAAQAGAAGHEGEGRRHATSLVVATRRTRHLFHQVGVAPAVVGAPTKENKAAVAVQAPRSRAASSGRGRRLAERNPLRHLCPVASRGRSHSVMQVAATSLATRIPTAAHLSVADGRPQHLPPLPRLRLLLVRSTSRPRRRFHSALSCQRWSRPARCRCPHHQGQRQRPQRSWRQAATAPTAAVKAEMTKRLLPHCPRRRPRRRSRCRRARRVPRRLQWPRRRRCRLVRGRALAQRSPELALKFPRCSRRNDLARRAQDGQCPWSQNRAHR